MIGIKTVSCCDDKYLRFVLNHFDNIDSNENGEYELSVEYGDVLKISKNSNCVHITVQTKYQLFFSVAMLLANISKDSFELVKSTPFESINFMCDCSRAAVLNVETAKELIVYLAKLGFTGFELYTEDTYEISDEPYFGHLRGRFSKAEIREIDAFAKQYGIELIPCIQTLAHLDNIFLWPHFEEVFDMWDCLAVGDPKTYDLIEKMFKNIADCFSSRTINIGYDEAYYAGRGKYLDKNGFVSKSKLLLEHLNKVADIGAKHGFKCIVYSDMFFGSKNDLNQADLPKNLEFNYWNYYKTDKRSYDKDFDKHLKTLGEVDFTVGAWKWLGHTPFNKYGMLRLKPGVTSAAEHGIKTVTLSAWGDNGSECALFAVIPQLVYFSQLTHMTDLSSNGLNDFCKAVFSISFRDLLKLDLANGHKNKSYSALTNPAKYLLYNDPLCGLMDYHVDASYNEYYEKCVKVLKRLSKCGGKWSYLFDVQTALCDYLSVKANMGNDLYGLYNKGDIQGLSEYAKTTVTKAIKKLSVLIDVSRTAWYKENKTFGFDVIEYRLGGQMQRLNEIIFRISKYASGEIKHIEELEQPKLPYNYPSEKDLVYKHNFNYIASSYHPTT